MAELDQLTKTTLEEIERLLDTKKVVGDPITAGENTVIPLISFGFGFGTGAGTGKASDKGEGSGGGAGGGGGIKPVAVIVIGKESVRLEPIKRGASSVLDRVVDTIGKAREKKSKESPES